MNRTNLLAGILLSALMLIASPASAVNPNGTYHLTRYNTGGTSFAIMRPTARGIGRINALLSENQPAFPS